LTQLSAFNAVETGLTFRLPRYLL